MWRTAFFAKKLAVERRRLHVRAVESTGREKARAI
jgi:hypothetical protein